MTIGFKPSISSLILPFPHKIIIIIPPANNNWGVYRNHPVCLSVCLSVHTYIISTTPPKPLNGF